jgi:hypothetical protein
MDTKEIEYIAKGGATPSDRVPDVLMELATELLEAREELRELADKEEDKDVEHGTAVDLLNEARLVIRTLLPMIDSDKAAWTLLTSAGLNYELVEQDCRGDYDDV